MLQGPETLREISFHQAFGRDLHEAKECCMAYKRTCEVGDLNQAWDLYYQVLRCVYCIAHCEPLGVDMLCAIGLPKNYKTIASAKLS